MAELGSPDPTMPMFAQFKAKTRGTAGSQLFMNVAIWHLFEKISGVTAASR